MREGKQIPGKRVPLWEIQTQGQHPAIFIKFNLNRTPTWMVSDYSNFKCTFYIFSDTKEHCNKKVTICHLQASEKEKITPTWQNRFLLFFFFFFQNNISIAALKGATIQGSKSQRIKVRLCNINVIIIAHKHGSLHSIIFFFAFFLFTPCVSRRDYYHHFCSLLHYPNAL